MDWEYNLILAPTGKASTYGGHLNVIYWSFRRFFKFLGCWRQKQHFWAFSSREYHYDSSATDYYECLDCGACGAKCL